MLRPGVCDLAFHPNVDRDFQELGDERKRHALTEPVEDRCREIGIESPQFLVIRWRQLEGFGYRDELLTGWRFADALNLVERRQGQVGQVLEITWGKAEKMEWMPRGPDVEMRCMGHLQINLKGQFIAGLVNDRFENILNVKGK